MPFTLTMPKLSPTMEEGTITLWHKKEGDRVEAGDLLFEVATDKATVEYSALDDGWLKKILIGNGGHGVVNQPVAVLTEEKNETIEGYQPEGVSSDSLPNQEKPSQLINESVVKKQEEQTEKRLFASPLAKKLASEKGIDLSTLSGSGPRGRVMSRDLTTAPQISKTRHTSVRKAPIVESLTPMRKVIAQRLQEAKSTIPHFYVEVNVDAAPLQDLREQLKNLNVVVSVNDCIVKAVALALQDHPEVNSGFNSKENTLIRYQNVDVAVAVSIPGGLITPIVTDADNKPLQEISVEIRALAKKAKEGKLDPSQYQGGSFTISNLGMFGVTSFQAIINPPQAAILAVGGILDVPVVKEGKIVPGKTMHLILSVDHRAIDGVAAAEFLSTLKNRLENPISLMFS